MEIKVIKISDGEKESELADRMIELINEYSGILTDFQIIGVIETVKNSAHKSIEDIEEEEWK